MTASGGLFADEGHQRDVTGAFDRDGQFSLVSGAGAGHTPGKDLRTLGYKPAQTSHILVIDGIDLIYAKAAHLAAAFTSAAYGTFGSISHDMGLLFMKSGKAPQNGRSSSPTISSKSLAVAVVKAGGASLNLGACDS